jgi:hypothetical protein
MDRKAVTDLLERKEARITGTRPPIRTAQSSASEARDAVRQFHAAVAQPDMALVIFFCSSEYDLEAISEEMNQLFAGVQVVGCTTAGEIGPAGYRDHSLTGASFPAGEFKAVSRGITGLRQFESGVGDAAVVDLLGRLERLAPDADPTNSFALMLIDGVAMREERVTHSLQNALGKLPLVGGSAGDGLNFGSTHVYFEGGFHADSAILTVVTTPLPFKLFKTQHFVAMDERMVVTDADADRRLVKELNGRPAAQEYARVLGLDGGALDSTRFAASPVVVMIDGIGYVRSIRSANADGSLTFFCAIENGLVLRGGKGDDLLRNLDETFDEMRAEIGRPQFVLGCDCVLRKLEIIQSPQRARISDVLQQNNTIGFNTYGEQFNGVHINQTLVGIAIGTGRRAANDV